MKLSREEELFLRHWIHDEAHYRDRIGPAKRLQVKHGARPADLALLIAAAIADLTEQEAAGLGPPPGDSPTWPWSAGALSQRVAEAEAILAKRHGGGPPGQAGAQTPQDAGTSRSPPQSPQATASPGVE